MKDQLKSIKKKAKRILKKKKRNMLNPDQMLLKKLQEADYSHLILDAKTSTTVECVKQEALAVYGKNYNFYSNALKREVVKGMETAIFVLAEQFKRLDYLEIGSCQGLSMSLISSLGKQFFKKMDSTSVDPYYENGYLEGKDGIWGKERLIEIDKSTKESAFLLYKKLGLEINLIEETSDVGLVRLLQEKKKFNLIYVDGSHENLVPLMDSGLSLAMLEKGGVIILDDHFWPDVKVIKQLFDSKLEKIYECWKIAVYKFN